MDLQYTRDCNAVEEYEEHFPRVKQNIRDRL